MDALVLPKCEILSLQRTCHGYVPSHIAIPTLSDLSAKPSRENRIHDQKSLAHRARSKCLPVTDGLMRLGSGSSVPGQRTFLA
jgi:hypothetical protein